MAETVDIDDRAEELVERTVLYEQQARVLARLEAGMSREEIADDLELSEHTVRRHQENIEAKLRQAAATVELVDVEQWGGEP